ENRDGRRAGGGGTGRGEGEAHLQPWRQVRAGPHAGRRGRAGRLAVPAGHLSAAERGVFPEADGAEVRSAAMKSAYSSDQSSFSGGSQSRRRLCEPLLNRWGLVLMLLLAPSVAGSAAEVQQSVRLAARDLLLSPEVVADKDGSVRLAHSVLIADE